MRPVTKPEWTGQGGDDDGDLKPSGPNCSAFWVVSEKALWWRAKGVPDASQAAEAETWRLGDIWACGEKEEWARSDAL